MVIILVSTIIFSEGDFFYWLAGGRMLLFGGSILKCLSLPVTRTLAPSVGLPEVSFR